MFHNYMHDLYIQTVKVYYLIIIKVISKIYYKHSQLVPCRCQQQFEKIDWMILHWGEIDRTGEKWKKY